METGPKHLKNLSIMKKKDVEITTEDVKFITKNDCDQIIQLVKFHSFCRNCNDKREVIMVNLKITLNHMNDLLFKGYCNQCKQGIAKYVEIGESKKYFLRTQTLRSKIEKDY